MLKNIETLLFKLFVRCLVCVFFIALMAAESLVDLALKVVGL